MEKHFKQQHRNIRHSWTVDLENSIDEWQWHITTKKNNFPSLRNLVKKKFFLQKKSVKEILSLNSFHLMKSKESQKNDKKCGGMCDA